jgi:glycosyltransferase involved in cell wall biosynthesis
MPFISVIVPTMRVGGLNVLFDSLARSEFTDFELVLVDALYPRRKEVVAEEARDRFLRVIHVEGSEHFPVTSYCAMMNKGIVAASGEVVVMAVDYTRFRPDTLGKHAAWHRENVGGLMGPHRYVKLDADKTFPAYGREEIDRYERDIRLGQIDDFMFSIGDATDEHADPFHVDGGTTATWDADPKLRMPAGPIAPAFLHCKNESVRLEALLEVNGFDEALDGCHGWQDSDLADRLAIKAGVRFTLDPTCVVDIANPRGVFPFAKRLRDFRTNEGIWYAARAAGYPTPNKYSLRERREQIRTTKAIRDEYKYVRGQLRAKTAEILTKRIEVPARKLRIAMVYGEFSSAIHGPFVIPDLYTKTGLTGSESSFFNLMRSLAERGHEVAAFCVTDAPCDHESGAHVFPIQALKGLPRAEGIDAVIAWNEPDYLQYAPAGALRVVDQQLNDWGYCRTDFRANVDLFVYPSANSMEHHRRDEGMPAGVVVPNSVDLSLFEKGGLAMSRPRNPHRVVWASSPDRGLHHVLSMWPDIRQRVPDAELHVFYRLAPWLERAGNSTDEGVARRARYIAAALPRLKGHGVIVRDLVSNAEMAREFQSAAVLAYPCDPVRYTEGFGCSVLDACAGGCLPIISDADALPEVHGSAVGIIKGRPALVRDAWVNLVTWALLEYPNTPQYADTQAKMQSHAQAHAREVVAAQWERVLGEAMRTTTTTTRPFQYAQVSP